MQFAKWNKGIRNKSKCKFSQSFAWTHFNIKDSFVETIAQVHTGFFFGEYLLVGPS